MSSSPIILKCGVCGEPAAARHFGAASCRACAAFFRRKVAAGKPIAKCRCAGSCKMKNQYLRKSCQMCRYEKCVESGMKFTAVLSTYGAILEPSASDPDNEYFLLNQLKGAYGRLENARNEAFKMEKRVLKKVNQKDAFDIWEVDINLILQHYGFFLEFSTPTNDEEELRKLSSNFKLPFSLLDFAFRSREYDLFVMPNGDYVDASKLNVFYEDPVRTDSQKAKNIAMLLEPFWNLKNQLVGKILKEIQLDLHEFLALSALLYWSYGVPEQSDGCLVICRQMRSKVLEELANYERSVCKSEDYALRVGVIVIFLQAIEKALGILNECKEIATIYNLDGRECPLFSITESKRF